MTSWPANYFNWVKMFRTTDAPSADQQLAVELSWVELCRFVHLYDATQLNSTSSWVELSCVAINGALCGSSGGPDGLGADCKRRLIHRDTDTLRSCNDSVMLWHVRNCRCYYYTVLFRPNPLLGLIYCWHLTCSASGRSAAYYVGTQFLF